MTRKDDLGRRGFAVTLVGAPLPAVAVERATKAVQIAGGQVLEVRNLSDSKAVDLICDLGSDQADQLTETLRPQLPKVDLAVVALRARRKQLICADMDSTIVVGETIEYMADVLGVRDQVAEITEQAMRGEIDFIGALVERVQLLRDLEEKCLTQIATQLNYHKGGRRLISTMKDRAGARSVLISGGFSQIAEVVRQNHGFDLQIANNLGVTGDGKLAGTVHLPIVDADRKLEVLETERKGLGLPADLTLAIGDGANDLPMIKAASMGIAFRAKPIVRDATRFQINHTDLLTALYYQGYADSEITGGSWDLP